MTSTAGPASTSGASSGSTSSDDQGTTDDATSTGAVDSSGGDTTGDATDSGGVELPRLHEATFDAATQVYAFTADYPLSAGPADIDWNRWALLHDGNTYRLYFLPEGNADEIYQFALNPNSGEFEYGFKSSDFPITGAPPEMDPARFGMAHDGANYHMYFLSQDQATLLGFGYDAGPGAYSYGVNAPASSAILGDPGTVDWTGWATLGDGSERLYAFASNAHDSLAEYTYDAKTGSYEYQDSDITLDLMTLDATPSDNFAMLHDGVGPRLYMLEVR